MRIVQISSSDCRGGAGRAAHRLCRGLRLLGCDCSMLVKLKSTADTYVEQISLEQNRRTAKLLAQADLVQRYCVNQRRTAVSNTYFSLPFPGFDLCDTAALAQADVLNLHWITDFLSPPAIGRLQSLGKAVVWTLHDQRAFTGGCHYSAGCNRYEAGCSGCPQLTEDRAGLVAGSFNETVQSLGPGLTVVSPSKWLAGCARRSRALGMARIEVIPNGLDTEVFKPLDKAAARASLGINPKAVCFLFGADYCEEKRKGFDQLCRAIRICMGEEEFRGAVSRNEIQFLVFGTQVRMPNLEIPVRWLGRFETEPQIAQVYAAADAFLLPSEEDNLPNTMVESMCCGTPVIGFDVGGLPDLITHRRTGMLAAPQDSHQLAQAIAEVAADAELRKSMSARCASEVHPICGLELQAQRYRNLYEELIRDDTRRTPNIRSSRRKETLISCESNVSLQPMGADFEKTFARLLCEASKARWRKRWKSLFKAFVKHSPKR